MVRTAVYVDGHYVHNALRKLGLEERDVAWDALFDRLVADGAAAGAPGEGTDEAADGAAAGPIERIHWHAAATVADVDFSPTMATRYCPPATDEATFVAEARAWYDAERTRIAAQPGTAERGVTVSPPAEVRVVPSGCLVVNPYRRAIARVDGIDVGIAVDLMAEIDYVGAAIVVSASTGLTPVVRRLRDRGTRVVRGTIVTPVASDAFDASVTVNEAELNDRHSPLLIA